MGGHSKTDVRMKGFEVYRDHTVPPESYIVVRLDGVGFSRLTKQIGCKKPFDRGFVDIMRSITQHLMTVVPDIEIGYVQSDEITLVFQRDTQWFSRRIEKLTSVLAAIASAYMAYVLNHNTLRSAGSVPALPSFDCRLSVFPTREHVSENLAWRIDDSVKNCRNLLTFWGHVSKGMSERAATKAMLNKGKDFQNEWLFTELGLNFNDFDPFLKRGTLLYKATVYREGYNPVKKQPTLCLRPVVVADDPLPHPAHETPLAFVDRRRVERRQASSIKFEQENAETAAG